MNTTLNKVFIFAAGAVIGSVVTWKLLDKKLKDEYEQRLAEDTASVKEAFTLSKEDYEDVMRIFPKEEKSSDEEETPRAPISYTDRLSTLGYAEDFEEPKVTTKKEAMKMEDVEHPYVIDPREYGEYADYDTETLYYYTDDVLADSMDNVVEDIEDTVSSYALTTFGQYEDDAVHVRNDVKRRYYEILRSECAYSEKYGQNLYRKED